MIALISVGKSGFESLKMDVIESIYSWKRRTLDPLENFQDVVPVELVAKVQSAFMDDEVVLGVYFNSEAEMNANLVFTTRGIYQFTEAWHCVEYGELTAVRIIMRGENVEKHTANTLIISYKNGEERRLIVSGAVLKTISGEERRFPDIYAVHRFLRGVIRKFHA